VFAERLPDLPRLRQSVNEDDGHGGKLPGPRERASKDTPLFDATARKLVE
jgi:hypothetical protein